MGEVTCLARVFRSYWEGKTRCTRKPWKNGYCEQHHPDTAAAKDAERETKGEARRIIEDRRARTILAERTVLQAAEEWRDAPYCADDVQYLAAAVDALREARK